MRPPSTEKPLIKTGEGLYFSQLNQDRKIDMLLKRKRDGFVVEAGVSQQNSRFFEVTRNWGCLLIEGNPNFTRRCLPTSAIATASRAASHRTRTGVSSSCLLTICSGRLCETEESRWANESCSRSMRTHLTRCFAISG